MHGDYKRSGGGQGQVTDTDGANGRCAYSVWYTSPIVEHRTCEEVDFWPDMCGNWNGTQP